MTQATKEIKKWNQRQGLSNCLLCDQELSNQESLRDLILMKENLTMCDNCKNKFEQASEASCKTCCKKVQRFLVKIAEWNEKEKRKP